MALVNDQVSTRISRIVSKSNRYVLGCVHRHPISVAFSAHHRYLVFVGQRLRPSLLRPRTLVFIAQHLCSSFSAHHQLSPIVSANRYSTLVPSSLLPNVTSSPHPLVSTHHIRCHPAHHQSNLVNAHQPTAFLIIRIHLNT